MAELKKGEETANDRGRGWGCFGRNWPEADFLVAEDGIEPSTLGL